QLGGLGVDDVLALLRLRDVDGLAAPLDASLDDREEVGLGGLAALVDLELADVGVEEPDGPDADLVAALHRGLVGLVDLVAPGAPEPPSSSAGGSPEGGSPLPFESVESEGDASGAAAVGTGGGPSDSVVSSSGRTRMVSTTRSPSFRDMTRTPMLAR